MTPSLLRLPREGWAKCFVGPWPTVYTLQFAGKPADGFGQSFSGDSVAGIDPPASFVDFIKSQNLRAALAVDCFTEVLLVGEDQDRHRPMFDVFVRQRHRQFLPGDTEPQLVCAVQYEYDPVAQLVELFPSRK